MVMRLAVGFWLLGWVGFGPSIQIASAEGVVSSKRGVSVPVQNDATVEELESTRQKQKEAFEVLNTLNPLTEQYGQSAPHSEYSEGVRVPPEYQKLYELLNHPAVRAYLKFFSDPSFLKGATALSQHPHRMILLYAQLGWVLVVLLLKGWRKARAQSWVGRFWVSIWTSGVYLLGASLLLPTVILGEPYLDLLKGMIETLSK